MISFSHTVHGAGHFKILPLGTAGGIFEDNLSSYLVSSTTSGSFIALDAGTLCGSINKISPKTFKQLKIKQQSTEAKLKEHFFKTNIKAYLISHAHLDHISGLAICSTNDSNKQIFGSKATIDNLKNNIFNWKIWPNFADQGEPPFLRQYQYRILKFNQSTIIPNTDFIVKAFPLSHGPSYTSTAFLLEAKGFYLLYFGDTGSDRIEQSHNIEKIWQASLSLIKEKKLIAIFIEVSYSNNRPDKLLFGHLTPTLLFEELNNLNSLLLEKNVKDGLKNLPIIITHMKIKFNSKDSTKIKLELEKNNNLKVRLIFPRAGQLINL